MIEVWPFGRRRTRHARHRPPTGQAMAEATAELELQRHKLRAARTARPGEIDRLAADVRRALGLGVDRQ